MLVELLLYSILISLFFELIGALIKNIWFLRMSEASRNEGVGWTVSKTVYRWR